MDNLEHHDDVIKMETFSALLAIVRGIDRSPVNSPHKGQWRVALMFTLISARINGWVNNREAGDLRRYRTHYDVIVMHFVAIQCNMSQLNQLQSATIYHLKCSYQIHACAHNEHPVPMKIQLRNFLTKWWINFNFYFNINIALQRRPRRTQKNRHVM